MLQLVPISLVRPSPDNVRLFIEEEELAPLVEMYNSGSYLPDAPIVRCTGVSKAGVPILECLAGERRITAAALAGRDTMLVRSVQMQDRDAYDFILSHNDVKPLSVVELAYRAAEMERLGYSDLEIGELLRGKSIYRYLEVGRLIDASMLTNTPKLCDPGIIVWYEAAKLGAAHFRKCLKAWDLGQWTEQDCNREFRRRGRVLPPDMAERGFRVTFNRDRLILRGQVDLDIHDPITADAMLETVIEHLEFARTRLKSASGMFSETSEVLHVNPLTV